MNTEPRKLRSGFTTGTCAAAAVSAAVKGLFLGQVPDISEVMTPAGILAKMQIEDVCLETGYVRCGVRKDAGDDPDVTNGTWIGAAVYTQESGKERFAQKKAQVTQYGYEEQEDHCWIGLFGGEGVGIVTKKGLLCPIGHSAINPVPRKMIFQAAKDAMREAGQTEGEWILEILIPEGKELAEHTFNPRLGICGGISVLGSSGVVEPMSEAALQATIDLELHMQAVQGERFVILTPGNYGEQFIRESMGLSLDGAVKCSNFIGDSIEKAAEEGFLGILLVGHIGKCIKVSLGVRNTHSRYGDRRAEGFLCALEAVKHKIPWEHYEKVRKQVELSNTSEEAAEYLKQSGVLELVMKEVMARIQKECAAFCKKTLQIEAVTFSSHLGLLGKTEGADDIADKIRERGKRT